MLHRFVRSPLLLSLCAVLCNVSAPSSMAAETDCAPADGYGFVCGPQGAEDLVQVPGTSWIIASGYQPGISLYLINAQNKSWSGLFPGSSARIEHDRNRFPACPGAPDTSNFLTHGLNLRAQANGQSTLYVVSHGAREAIEVFAVDASGRQPVVTWQGCVLMPEGLAANSVASFSDGSLVATVLVLPGIDIRDAIAGKPSGAVYEWKPGTAGFILVEGSSLPANNGIETAADDSEFYVASSGLHTVVAFSHSNPARLLRSTAEFPITPDNVHRDSSGKLITAGMLNEDPKCGSIIDPDTFDLATIPLCSRPFMAYSIDPQTMQHTVLSSGPATPSFSNATMALQVGNEVWVGTFSGQRVAWRPLP